MFRRIRQGIKRLLGRHDHSDSSEQYVRLDEDLFHESDIGPVSNNQEDAPKEAESVAGAPKRRKDVLPIEDQDHSHSEEREAEQLLEDAFQASEAGEDVVQKKRRRKSDSPPKDPPRRSARVSQRKPELILAEKEREVRKEKLEKRKRRRETIQKRYLDAGHVLSTALKKRIAEETVKCERREDLEREHQPPPLGREQIELQ